MPECPRCSTALRVVMESSVELDVCDCCGGVWLDAGELGRVADAPLESLTTLSLVEVQDLNCPRCRTKGFVSIKTDLGDFEKCGSCDGLFVSHETLDAISKSERKELPGKKNADAVVGPLQLTTDLFEVLWIFGQN